MGGEVQGGFLCLPRVLGPVLWVCSMNSLLAHSSACQVFLQGHSSSTSTGTECSVFSFIFLLLIQHVLQQHGVTDTAGKRYTKLSLPYTSFLCDS